MGCPNEAKASAHRPLVAESQPEQMVAFLKDEPASQPALIEMPIDSLAMKPTAEGLPESPLHTIPDTKHGFGTGRFAEIEKLVGRIIGKQAALRIPATTRQSTIAGHKHPVIVAAQERHEERLDAIDMRDPEVVVAIDDARFRKTRNDRHPPGPDAVVAVLMMNA